MSANYNRGPEMTKSSCSFRLPDTLMIAFDGTPQLSLAGSAMSIDSWEREDGSEPIAATISIKCRAMALHVELDAATLRTHAAACLRVADRLDGGKGKQ